MFLVIFGCYGVLNTIHEKLKYIKDKSFKMYVFF